MQNNRQLVLYGALGIVVVTFAGDHVKQKYVDQPLQNLMNQRTQLEKQIASRNLEFRIANRSVKQLETLNDRSLPSNLQLARSSYRTWLLDLIERTGLKSPSIDSAEPVNRGDMFHALVFTVRSRGSLTQITEFLYQFYHCGQIHKITSLSLTPMQVSNQLDLSLTIEAIALKTAEAEKELALSPVGRLASDNVEDYSSIVDRNLFGGAARNSLARQTVLTAVTSDVNGQPEAWFRNAKTKQTLIKKPGETLKIDELHAVVVTVAEDRVVLDIDGERRGVQIGKSLAEAVAEPIHATARASF